jgi:hypothetical protein
MDNFSSGPGSTGPGLFCFVRAKVEGVRKVFAP